MSRVKQLYAATEATRKAVKAAIAVNAAPSFIEDLKFAEYMMQEVSFCAHLCTEQVLALETYSRLLSVVLGMPITVKIASAHRKDIDQFVDENSEKEPA
jgi:hypothetical protein